MAFQTAAGASISFSAAAPASYNSTGYAALTYSAAAEVTNIGDFGGEFALVTHLPLASRGVKKGKGSYNNGTINPTMAYDAADAGYLILQTATSTSTPVDAPISVKVELQGGEIFYFEALAMSMRTTVGEADSVIMASPTLELTDNPIVIVV